jgi:hypothetical protein
MSAIEDAARIIINKRGGKQSTIKGRCAEIPPLAMIELSSVMGLGASNYPRESDGTPNWHKIDCYSNLDHCLEHAFNFLAERNKVDRDVDKMREELSHTMARACMAMEQFLREEI